MTVGIGTMDEPPPDFRLLRFSSSQLPAKDRFDIWREVLTRKLLRMSVDPVGDGPFKAEARLRIQHGLTIGSGYVAPTVSRRTPEIVAADNDDLVLMVNLDGPFTVTQGDREVTLGAGDATLVSCEQVGSFLRPTGGRVLCSRLSRASLAQAMPDPEARTGRLIPRMTDPLRLLLAYSAPLMNDDDVALEPRLSRSVADHISDLTALILGARGDSAEQARLRGGRAAKLQTIKRAIDARVGAGDFSVDDIASEVGVSARYVRKLLEAEGLSFSRYVMERRLDMARGMLTSPRFARASISTIAFDVGFGDLSYFNRAFRRRFERTPSDLRAEYG